MTNNSIYRSFDPPLGQANQPEVAEDSLNPNMPDNSGSTVALPTLTVGILTPLGVISVVAAELTGSSSSRT